MKKAALVLCREEREAERRAEILERMGLRTFLSSTLKDAGSLLRREKADVILAEVGRRGFSGERLLALLESAPGVAQLVLVVPYGAISEAVDMLSRGAVAYVFRPVDEEEVQAVVGKALQQGELLRRQRELEDALGRRSGRDEIVGRCESMQRVLESVRQAAPTAATILITGESGTGKEMVARLIHRLSGRTGAFVPVACGALPETLFESELFGHTRGAFSGARGERAGRFQAADGGTLFLDEVGDIPLSLQAKLLRAIEQREVVRLGENVPTRVDARLVAATHRDLEAMVKDGAFREDLYWRLRVVRVRIPPLRERRGDIALLIEHFLKLFSAEYGKRVDIIEAEALSLLRRYGWPGNVRELRNCVESMVAVARSPVLTTKEIPDYIVEQAPEHVERAAPTLGGRPLEEIERQAIRETLALVGGNRRRAARLLGIGERTLYRKMKEYGLRQP